MLYAWDFFCNTCKERRDMGSDKQSDLSHGVALPQHVAALNFALVDP